MIFPLYHYYITIIVQLYSQIPSYSNYNFTVKARALGLGRHQGEDPPAAVGAVAPIAVGDPAQLNAWGQQFTEEVRYVRSICVLSITGWWYTYPSEKYESQLGWWHSQYMEKYKMFQTTNQALSISIYVGMYVSMDLWIYICIDGWWLDERMNGCMNEWMNGCMDAWMHGCMDACMDGWMDGQWWLIYRER